jgi:hypothetical protein
MQINNYSDFNKIQDIIQELKDILLELEDLGYETKVLLCKRTITRPDVNNSNFFIEVSISNRESYENGSYYLNNYVKIKSFKEDDDFEFNEVILRCKDFMKNHKISVQIHDYLYIIRFYI